MHRPRVAEPILTPKPQDFRQKLYGIGLRFLDFAKPYGERCERASKAGGAGLTVATAENQAL
tara:strand:- start:6004 stop:6189 length:186 start_codon:yes stop_codon:yes gene_type:complete